jgi:hypothetical protein
MIEDALQELAPKTYRDLKRSGQLKQFLLDREEALMEEYHQAENVLHDQMLRSKKPGMERVQEATMGQHQAWHQALSNHLEFSDPETTE